jgi:hypothetical protein|tara:strand:+ start:165 stop:341 length:177 start_codon:yes stop_codon:yes gene_type:complete
MRELVHRKVSEGKGSRSGVIFGVLYGGLDLPKKRFTWIVLGFATLKPTYPKNEQGKVE